MKRLMAIASALALAAPLGGCVANQGDTPIRFLWVRALEFQEGIGCVGSEERIITDGFLDISGGYNFPMPVSVETNTFQQPITIGQEPFAGEGLGDITLNEIVYSYEFQPVLGSGAINLTLPADEADRVAYYGVFRPETDPEESYTFIGALGPGALKALYDTLRPYDDRGTLDPADDIPGTAVTVLSTIQARGRLSGGQTVVSNKFTFPVTVVNSGFSACPPGEVPNGICGLTGVGGTVVCAPPES